MVPLARLSGGRAVSAQEDSQAGGDEGEPEAAAREPARAGSRRPRPRPRPVASRRARPRSVRRPAPRSRPGRTRRFARWRSRTPHTSRCPASGKTTVAVYVPGSVPRGSAGNRVSSPALFRIVTTGGSAFARAPGSAKTWMPRFHGSPGPRPAGVEPSSTFASFAAAGPASAAASEHQEQSGHQALHVILLLRFPFYTAAARSVP